MVEMNQDEEYLEEEVNESLEEESSEDTESGFDFIFGIPKNIFFIICAAVVLVLLIIIIIGVRVKGNSNKEPEVYYPSYNYEETPATNVDYNTTVTEPVVTEPVNPFDGYLYSSTGDYLYMLFADDYVEGAEIGDMQTLETCGTFSLVSGIEVFDKTGAPIGYVVLADGDNFTDVSDVRVQLRKVGYTGDEIDYALKYGIDTEALIAKAQELRDKEAEEALVRMSDSASDEFKYMLNWSTFCLEPGTFLRKEDAIKGNNAYAESSSYLVNADFEKCPIYGYQLQFKCKIANDTYVFMQVNPSLWAKYPDKGNIVLRVHYELYGSDSDRYFYVTKVEEVDITNITVNPEDSTVSLNRILGLE